MLQLALKAQSNGRATLEALINAKQPKQVAFVRQANVAHTQQVNNGVASSHVGNEAKTPNELTVEQAHGG
ncbi:hypothetical protein CCO03_13485 [Comamonas serinivorans]|uniref:Uncharacterized protein n=1 Tax=Comamonas serinivorans TaxID=1082851 RepID=A0A1Y0EQH6_9BURK|nr:hypothetical protein CCO03_13485 [Comamonas serinivorans]